MIIFMKYTHGIFADLADRFDLKTIFNSWTMFCFDQIQSTFFGQFVVLARQGDPSSPIPVIFSFILRIDIDDQSSCYCTQ